MDPRAVISCPHCREQARVPADRGALRVRCPYCNEWFAWTPNPQSKQSTSATTTPRSGFQRWGLVVAVLAVVVLVFALGQWSMGRKNTTGISFLKQTRYARINYDDLTDKGHHPYWKAEQNEGR